MKKIYDDFVGGRAAAGLLIVRLVFGLGILQHGWPKIQHAFNWMGPDAPVPGLMQALAALSEFGGGLALMLGLLTPLAMFGLTCTMLVAIVVVHLSAGDPFVSLTGSPSYELAALYLAVALTMIIIGPGKFSLDALLFGKRHEMAAPVKTVQTLG